MNDEPRDDEAPYGAKEQRSDIASQYALRRVGGELRVLADAVQALAERQTAIEGKLADLRDHSNTVGYLVEKIVAQTAPRSEKMARAARRFGRFLSPVLRIARRLASPSQILRSVRDSATESRETSRVLHWREDLQKWVPSIDRIAWARKIQRAFVGQFFDVAPPIYRVKPIHRQKSGARPRILFVAPNVFMGGTTQLIVDLFNHLGHKYEMHAATAAFPPGRRHEGMIIHDFREPISVASIKELLAKFQPEIVHVHYWGDVDLPWYKKVFEAAATMNCPVIQNVNTPVTPYTGHPSAHYVYVSEYVRHRFGLGRQDESVIVPGIDFAHFGSPSSLDACAANSIGMVYRLEIDKLNEQSIEPLIRVVRKRPRTRVVIIGGGTLFAPFLRRVVEEGMHDNFMFTGAVPYQDLPRYYAMFGLFVAPVWKESFGQVVPFAMNMGLAVAGNKIGALPEILGSDATLGESAEETANIIVKLLDDPAAVSALGAANQKRAQALYGVEKMCGAYDRLYSSLLPAGEDPMYGFPPALIFDRDGERYSAVAPTESSDAERVAPRAG